MVLKTAKSLKTVYTLSIIGLFMPFPKPTLLRVCLSMCMCIATSIVQYTRYSCVENTLIEKPGRPQSTGSQRVGHDQRDPVCIDRLFFACDSSAPVKVVHEGGSAAWVAGTMVAPSVQGYGLPQPLVYWAHQSPFSSLWYLTIRRPLRLVFVRTSARSGT